MTIHKKNLKKGIIMLTGKTERSEQNEPFLGPKRLTGKTERSEQNEPKNLLILRRLRTDRFGQKSENNVSGLRTFGSGPQVPQQLPLQEEQEAFVGICKTVSRRNLSGKKLIAYKQELSLTTIQKEVLIGTLLGDASISCRLGKPVYSVKFEQKHTQFDYIDHLYEVFEPFVGTSPQMRTIINDFHKTPGQSCWFRTYSHASLKYYYDLFYVVNEGNRRVKCVPKTIAKLLTPRALAYWYMDDGTVAFDKWNNASFVLNTQGFNHADHKRLVLALKIKFGIKATILKDKTYFRLRIARESKANFLSLIQEHIVPSFIYKLGRVRYIN